MRTFQIRRKEILYNDIYRQLDKTYRCSVGRLPRRTLDSQVIQIIMLPPGFEPGFRGVCHGGFFPLCRFFSLKAFLFERKGLSATSCLVQAGPRELFLIKLLIKKFIWLNFLLKESLNTSPRISNTILWNSKLKPSRKAKNYAPHAGLSWLTSELSLSFFVQTAVRGWFAAVKDAKTSATNTNAPNAPL